MVSSAYSHEGELVKKPSILWIHQSFITWMQPGNSRPVRIVTALLSRGCTVEVIAPTVGYLGGNPASSATAEDAIPGGGRLRIHRLVLPERHTALSRHPWTYMKFAAAAFLRALSINNISVIYCSTPPLPQVTVSILASILKGVPIVLEVRDLWPGYLRDCGFVRSRTLLTLLGWLEATVYRYAEACIAVSPSYREYLSSMGVSKEKVFVVPTGSDPVFATLSGSSGMEWRRLHGFEEKFLVLYAGSFNETYRFDIILAVAEKLCQTHPHIVWLFAGNGRQKPLIQAAAARCASVRYLGILPKDELLPIFLAADLGLVTHAPAPLLSTALSAKLFDYIAAGMAVINMAAGITGELLNLSGAGITIDEPTIAGLEHAVLKLSTTPLQDRKEAGLRARTWMLRHLNAVAMGDAVARVVMQSRPAASRTGLFLKALRSAALGFMDVVSGRSAACLRALHDRDPRIWSAGLWRDWLDEHQDDSTYPKSTETHVSEILSGIDRHIVNSAYK